MPETDVERLFRLLVLTLHAGDPAQLAAPVRLHDVLSRILPYRNVRRALGVDTSEDFELMLLRLAGGEAGFVATDPEPVHARFAEEAVSVNPDLGVLQEFRDAQLRLDPDAVAWVLSGGGQEEAYAPPEAGATPPPEVPQPAPPSIPTSPPATPTPPTPSTPTAPPPRPPITPEPPAPPPAPPPAASSQQRPDSRAEPARPAMTTHGCLTCGGQLPRGRIARFCPHCGHAQAQADCPHCTAEVEYGWNYCVNCGGGLAWEG